MSDQPIIVPVTPVLDGIAAFASGLENLTRLVDAAAEFDPKGKMKVQLGAIANEIKKVALGTAGFYADITKTALDSIKEVAEETVETVRSARQRVQSEYEKMRAETAKPLSIKVISDFKSEGASLFPADSRRLQEYTDLQRVKKQAQDAQLAEELADAEALAKFQRDLDTVLMQQEIADAQRLQTVYEMGLLDRFKRGQVLDAETLANQIKNAGAVAALQDAHFLDRLKRGNIGDAEALASQVRLAEAQKALDEANLLDKLKRGNQLDAQLLAGQVRAAEAQKALDEANFLDRLKRGNQLDAEMLASQVRAAETMAALQGATMLDRLVRGNKADAAHYAEQMSLESEAQKLKEANVLALFRRANELDAAHYAEQLRLEEKALQGRAFAQAKAATLQPTGSYSTISSGATNLVRNSELDMTMPSKALFLEAEAAKAASLAHLQLGGTTAAGVAPAKALQQAHLDLSGGMKDLHSGARGLASGFNAMWLTWGNILPLMAGAAVSGAAAKALSLGADVGQSLETIRSLGGASTQEIAALNDVLHQTAVSGPFGPGEVAKALKTLSLAGLDARDQIAAIKPVLDFAVAGDMPIEKSAESLVAIGTAFGYSMKDLSVVSDVVAKTAAISMASTEGMSQSFKVASVVAQQYHVSLTDVATSLALLAQVGIKDQAAGTSVRQMYAEMLGNSSKARAVMKDVLKFDAFDEQTKKLKDLPTLITGLSEAFIKLDAKSQLTALNTLGNERGTKAISANLQAVQVEFDKSGKAAKDFVTTMQQTQQDIKDAPGFSAIAAIGMGSSTMNQMKQTASTLQDALVTAFQSAEPAILRVNQALQDIFKSSGFKTSVTAMVTAVADLTRWLLDHAEAVLNVGKAYVVYKVATVTYTAATVGLTFANTLLSGSFARAVILSAEMEIAMGATTIGAYTAATAMNAFNLAIKANPIGLIITALIAAGTAWYLYADSEKAAADASNKASGDYQAATKATVEGLDKEIKRLDTLLEAKGDDKLATKLQAQSVRDAAIEGVEANGALAVSSLEAARARQAQANADIGWLDNLGLVSKGAKEANAQRLADMDEQIKLVKQQTRAEAQALADKFQMVKDKSAEAEKLAEGRRKPGIPTGAGTFDPDTLTKKGGASSDNSLSQITKQYDTQMSLIKSLEGEKLKVANAMRSANLISQEGFYAQEIVLADSTERSQLDQIRVSSAAYSEAYDKRWRAASGGKDKAKVAQDLNNLTNERITSDAKFAADEAKLLDAANTRKLLQEIAFNGQLKKIKDDAKDFDQSETRNEAKRLRGLDYAEVASHASADEVQVLGARSTEYERLTAKVEDYDASIRKLGEALADDIELAYAQGPVSAETVVALAKETELVGRLTEAKQRERDRFAGTIPTKVDKAGEDAATALALAKKREADWMQGSKMTLEAYARTANNTAKSMGDVFAKTFKGMEDGILKFVKTGELSFDDLANSIIDDLVRIAIQKTITGPLAAGLGGFMDSIFGSTGGATTSPVTSGSVGGWVPNALGGVYNSPGLSAYSGQVVSSPTMFAFAKGAGLMGEAGPEAIMPLTRGPNGKLGVQSSGAGGGNSMVVNIIESADKGGQVQRRTENGVDIMDVFVEKVKSSIAGDISKGSGAVPNAMSATYGLNRVAGAY